MANSNDLLLPFHIKLVFIVLIYSLIFNDQFHVKASLDIFPLWNVTYADNETEPCFLTIEKNITKLFSQQSYTCGVKLVASENAGVMIQIPDQASLDTFLYVDKQDDLLDCENRYVVITTYNSCFTVFQQTTSELLLQGNTSILISETLINQSHAICPKTKLDDSDSESSGTKRCHTKEFNHSLSCYVFSDQECVFELPSYCSAVLGNRQIQFICPDNDFHNNNTALLIYPGDIMTLDFEGGNVVEINNFAFITLKGLEELDISYNSLSQLHARAFAGLENLNKLNLRQNLLQSLQNEIFQDLVALTSLYLENNELGVLPDGLFKDVRKITILFLYSNQLGILTENILILITCLSSQS